MSTFATHIRAAETGRTHTASTCLALVDRALARLENEQAAFRRLRAEMKAAIRLSGPAKRITPLATGSHIGKGIVTHGVRPGERRPTPEAMELIREYAASGTMKRAECAQRAGVSEPTVTKYARMIAEGKL